MGEASTRPVSLTVDGRKLLEQRVRALDAAADELGVSCDDPDARAANFEAFLRATRERDRLRLILDEATTIEETVPEDPTLVDVGDAVRILLEDGTEETYILVHAAEAAMDEDRISVDSPLAGALLSRPVGDTVEVTVPAGSYRCTILAATRPARAPEDAT